MCKYCEKSEDLGIEYLSASINGNVLTIGYDAYSCDSSFSIDWQIIFCPYCGHK